MHCVRIVFFMFDNCFNILLHSKVLNKFSNSFLNGVLFIFDVFSVLKAHYFIYLFSLPQRVISGFICKYALHFICIYLWQYVT